MRLKEECSEETWQNLIYAAIKHAKAIAKDKVIVFADLGPLEEHQDGNDYIEVIDIFLKAGITHFLFETLTSNVGVVEACDHIKQNCFDAVVMIS